MIEFENTGKRYGGKWAVRGLTCGVEKGEIFGLLGPNGAGKTTTIRMMTGIVRPTEGRILIGGHDVVSDPLLAKSLSGYVPDSSYLYEGLSGKEFLAFISSLYGVEKDAAVRGIDRLMGIMGIMDAGDVLIGNYSHGMRQRLLFSAALIHNPKVLIIDEPFAGLDPYGIKTIKGLIRELSADGVAVFLATHSLHIAEELCHKAGIIHGGALVTVMDRKDFAGEDAGLEKMFIRLTS
jgi:ABC-2 type transport system ATP-binding protein